mmetsp:Transcript_14256/g.16157  ORF Transcript_14256/g.16157 Transcript_14256/m.16157 type:complete len:504 (-) Transcript_14256:292-1803(-)
MSLSSEIEHSNFKTKNNYKARYYRITCYMLLFTLKSTCAFIRSGVPSPQQFIGRHYKSHRLFSMAVPQKQVTRCNGAADELPVNTSITNDNIIESKAKLISSSLESLTKAGQRIREGHLVSFPTETVYGLGCHALDPVAVKRVFEAKERPLTDPLIVHVNEGKTALDLWDASSSHFTDNGKKHEQMEKMVLQALVEEFWPGPLTIVAKASPKVPSIIMANTGFVACRSPSHPIARSLIEVSEVPIAAPSANKFGHVSPTKASHVFDDLGMENVWIVDPFLKDENSNVNGSSSTDTSTNTDHNVVCNVGVESTVAKVEYTPGNLGLISVLRHGAISIHEISRCLEKAGLSNDFRVKGKHQATGDDVSNVAPGQTIRHYSPNVQSFMIAHDVYSKQSIDDQTLSSRLSKEEICNLESAVIIDFGGRLSCLREKALAYRDLSQDADSGVAATNVFDVLRWSETQSGAKRVYFPEIVVSEDADEALVLAVKDRLSRAASGVIITSLI